MNSGIENVSLLTLQNVASVSSAMEMAIVMVLCVSSVALRLRLVMLKRFVRHTLNMDISNCCPEACLSVKHVCQDLS